MSDAHALPAQPPQRSIDAIIGANVHQLMWSRQETQTQVAPEWGMDQTTLSNKLRGKRPWRADEIVAAAERYSVSVGALFSESRPKDYRSEGSLASVTNIKTPRRQQGEVAPVAHPAGRDLGRGAQIIDLRSRRIAGNTGNRGIRA